MPRINMALTGSNLRKIMDEKDISVMDISNRLDISVSAIYHWFYGISLPTIDNLVIVARLLGVTVDDILVVEE